jgi:hypothetical protein
MRFVPFIGSLIAAFFPVEVAAGADPGWSIAVMTAVLFMVSEPAAGQLVEPLVYGPRTGLSPVAVVLSTLFWTAPVGSDWTSPRNALDRVSCRARKAYRGIEIHQCVIGR